MKYIKKLIIIPLLIISASNLFSQKLFIQMDLSQTDHLKAYGIVYWALQKGQTVDWLLNYRSGSFMTDYTNDIANECRIRGVSFETFDNGMAASIVAEVQAENVNMDLVKLEKAAKIAVYVQPGMKPWDDAVRMALEYAEVPYDMVWDEEVLNNKLQEYDWLHLFHEDFTGQYGKFYANYYNSSWYIEQVALNENMAKKMGYSKVSKMKLDVALKIKEFVANGGFLFAMCSATDSYDIALASRNIDICAQMYDGDPADPRANEKLDFSQTLAFENFQLVMDPYEYEYSNIDITEDTRINENSDYFTLFEFSAKYDPVPTMLTQDHANVIHGFMGQTTGFRRSVIKKSVTILGETDGTDFIRYIHGNLGRGQFTWFGGHDPEDYRHFVGEEPTDLRLHKNSPGYRLILNNVLFPSAKKKEQKT